MHHGIFLLNIQDGFCPPDATNIGDFLQYHENNFKAEFAFFYFLEKGISNENSILDQTSYQCVDNDIILSKYPRYTSPSLGDIGFSIIAIDFEDNECKTIASKIDDNNVNFQVSFIMKASAVDTKDCYAHGDIYQKAFYVPPARIADLCSVSTVKNQEVSDDPPHEAFSGGLVAGIVLSSLALLVLAVAVPIVVQRGESGGYKTIP